MTESSKCLIGILALVIVLGCPSPPDVPIVGVIVASEGDADYIGRPEKEVLEALQRDYASSTVKAPFVLRFANSEGKAARAADLYRSFAADSNVVAVIGPSTSGESIAVASLADELKVPVLSLAASKRVVTDNDGRVRPWMFKFAQNDDLAAKALLIALAADGMAKVAFLYSDDPFGRSGLEQFQLAAQAVGSINVEYVAAFDPKITSGAPVVAPLPSGLDAIVIWGTAPGPAEVVRALRRRGKAAIYLSHGSASSDFMAGLGADAQGIVVIGSRVLMPETALNPDLPADKVILDYQLFWGRNFRGAPSHFGGHARDAYEALVSALSTKGVRSRADVRQRLEQLETLNGVTGTFRFAPEDHAGLDASAFATFRMDGGMFGPHRKPGS